MPDTPSITIVKSFAWKGVYEEWSNKYHFSGTTPADLAAWTALAIALADQEKLALANTVSIRRAFGYEAGNENAVAVVDFATVSGGVRVGSQVPAGSGVIAPGDVAVQVRWKTAEMTTNNKPIYLRKYFHGAYMAGSGDTIANPQLTALGVLAAKLYDGTLPGSFRVCGPQGAAAVSHSVPTFAVTRQLRRRGKRNPTP